ncbi:MAG: cation-binding protein [Halieaceae bacterium]|nr:cation-binding protein [Halieaceae bacterium]MCP4468936.1 cation-binding protein [Halieaceae bacterium]MCP4840795.1 cation-binding protein [Halieaceae bacterium]
MGETIRGGDIKKNASPARSSQPLMRALYAEHVHMSMVMQVFKEQLGAIECGEVVDTHVVYEVMDYMVTWPDRFHHPREDLIYARVAEIDPGALDDVDTLQRDHDNTARVGRQLLKLIENWRSGEAAGSEVVTRGREYISHIYEHMNVEEKLVFPKVEATLTPRDWFELSEDDKLRGVSDSVFGPQVQREFRNMARKIRRGVRRSVEHGTMVEWVSLDAVMESFEVVSIAYDSARSTAETHARDALNDALGYFQKAPLSAPVRCAVNNTRLTFRLLGDIAEISLETLDDLSQVNQARKDRMRLLSREARR